MLRISQISLPLDHRDDAIPRAAAEALGVAFGDLLSWEVRREAIDARTKTDIRLVYAVDVSVRGEERIARRARAARVIFAPDDAYAPAHPGTEPLRFPPVVVGSGPAGLFAALILAQAGYRPIVFERGRPVEQRCCDVERFWSGGGLDPESNAQFGEGGAGAFSDGKLTTRIHDHRCRKVLVELVNAGAPDSILVSAKPHIGTDRLRAVVRALREEIVRLGAEVRFCSRVTGLRTDRARLCGLEINGGEVFECQAAIVAIGHSARDTFDALLRQGLTMVPKPFAIGVRVEHPQQLIDRAQFGRRAGHPRLGPADYRMAFHAPGGRSAYTFCMCPGGEVIGAASHPGNVVTNGMSRYARSGANANAALLVNVGPGDYPADDPLAGFRFQEQWERRAFEEAGGTYAAPVQLLGDFLSGRPSRGLGEVRPTYRPGVVCADMRRCLPEYVCDVLSQAIPFFARRLRGFDRADAILTGVETRSSCPVRIVRGADMQASIAGVYPAGEGAGYAGGIMSSAVDGIRAAEAVIARFARPKDKPAGAEKTTATSCGRRC